MDITSSQYVKLKDGRVVCEITPKADVDKLSKLAERLRHAMPT